MIIQIGRIRINTRGCEKKQYYRLDVLDGTLINFYGWLIVIDRRGKDNWRYRT